MLVGVRLGVGDRVAADLGQRERGAWSAPARRRPSPPAPAGRSPRRTTGRPRPARRRGSRAGRRSAGSPGRSSRRCGGNARRPPRRSRRRGPAAGEHQRGRVVAVVDGRGPAADQVGHVLARLLGAEEGDVAAAAQAEPGPDPGLLLLGRRVEQRPGRRRGRRRRCGSGRRRAAGSARRGWPCWARSPGSARRSEVLMAARKNVRRDLS